MACRRGGSWLIGVIRTVTGQIEVYDKLVVIRRILSLADSDEANWREDENVIDQLRRRVGSGGRGIQPPRDEFAITRVEVSSSDSKWLSRSV